MIVFTCREMDEKEGGGVELQPTPPPHPHSWGQWGSRKAEAGDRGVGVVRCQLFLGAGEYETDGVDYFARYWDCQGYHRRDPT